MRTDIESRVTGDRVRPDQDQVVVRVPAQRRYVGAVRNMATALAAQCELTLDQIEDVQLAVDEVCALLLPTADPSHGWLEVTFQLVEGRFAALAQVNVAGSARLDRTGLAWSVLEALGDDLEVTTHGRTLAISFAKERALYT
jgi:serine/threonine-protein kinase RsbW